jgi:beta-phosphoglucomutase-like phosphatase (HAD superfamily)
VIDSNSCYKAIGNHSPDQKLHPEIVIFDMDGLIFDSESISCSIFHQTSVKYGYNIPLSFFHSLVGISRPHRTVLYKEMFGADTDLEPLLTEVRSKIQACRASGEITLKPGVREIIEIFQRRSIRLAISSSTDTTSVRQMLSSSHLANQFEFIVGGDQLIHGKPHPDAYIRPCELAGVNPGQALALEDSQAGIRAAVAAGVPVICVPDLQQPDDYHRKMSFAVVKSLFEVPSFLSDCS